MAKFDLLNVYMLEIFSREIMAKFDLPHDQLYIGII